MIVCVAVVGQQVRLEFPRIFNAYSIHPFPGASIGVDLTINCLLNLLSVHFRTTRCTFRASRMRMMRWNSTTSSIAPSMSLRREVRRAFPLSLWVILTSTQQVNIYVMWSHNLPIFFLCFCCGSDYPDVHGYFLNLFLSDDVFHQIIIFEQC